MTQCVVDGLEVVQIDEHHRSDGATVPIEGGHEVLPEQGAVRQVGQRVMCCLVCQLTLEHSKLFERLLLETVNGQERGHRAAINGSVDVGGIQLRQQVDQRPDLVPGFRDLLVVLADRK